MRTNKYDPYRANDDGTNLLTAIAAWHLLRPEERTKFGLNSETFSQWLVDAVGINVKSAPRFHSLVKAPLWAEMAVDWCNFSFGRQTFVVSNWTDAISTRIPSVC
jgi:hypothetical protein